MTREANMGTGLEKRKDFRIRKGREGCVPRVPAFPLPPLMALVILKDQFRLIDSSWLL